MRKLFLSFAMLLAFVGCSDDGGVTDDGGQTPSGPSTPSTPEEEVVYTAPLESPEGLDFAWVSEPEKSVIAVFRSARNEKFEYTGEENNFKKVDKTKPSTAVPTVYGVYPRKSSQKISASGDLTIALPDYQTYNATGTIDFEKNPMVAAAENLESSELPFKNLCGYLCVKAYGSIPPVKEIEIKGRDNEILAGSVEIVPQWNVAPEYSLTSGSDKITINCIEPITLGTTAETATSFYFIVAPNTLSKGITITFRDADGKKIDKRLDQEVVIKRNELTTIEPIEVIKEIVSDVIFDVKFNLDGTATDEGRFDLEVVKKTDVYGNTPYMDIYQHPQFPHNNIVRYNKAFMNGEHMTDSYFYAILNNDFNEAVEDGCTIELVASQPYISYDAFSRIFSTEVYGFMQRGWGGSGALPYALIWNSDQWGNNTVINVIPAPEPNTFYHYMLAYEALSQSWTIYRNGRVIGSMDGVVLDSSVYLGIGGWPQGGNPDRLAQCFMGDVAMLRFYDSVYTEEQILERYTALNIPQNAVSDYYEYKPIVDLQFNEDGSATNVGTLQSAVVTTKRNSANELPGLEVIQVGDKQVASFSRPLGADSKELDIAEDSYYQIDGYDFLQKINDGSFSVEIIAAGKYKNLVTPVSSESFRLAMVTGMKGYRPCYRFMGDGSALFTEGYYSSRIAVESNEYFHYIVTYDKFQATVTAFYDGQVRDENAGTWNYDTFLNGFNEALGVYVGANVNDQGTHDQRFDGKIASLRIYDEPLHGYKARNLIDQRRAEVAALNAAAGVEVTPPAPIANVQFNLDGTATETVNSYEVQTYVKGNGSGLTVSAPANAAYTLNNVVNTGPNSGTDITCYLIDLTQDDELFDILNKEFTIEVIHAAPHNNGGWAGLFGGEGFSLLRLAGYGYKWNENARNTVPQWKWHDGEFAPTPNYWYHTIFTYDAVSQTFSVYRDGALDMKNGATEKHIGGEMWQNTQLLIGARLAIDLTGATDNWQDVRDSWGGSIALFRVYDERVTPRQVKMMYDAVRPQVSALNEAPAQ